MLGNYLEEGLKLDDALGEVHRLRLQLSYLLLALRQLQNDNAELVTLTMSGAGWLDTSV